MFPIGVQWLISLLYRGSQKRFVVETRLWELWRYFFVNWKPLLYCYWPLFSAPTYLFDDLIEQLRVYILPVSSYSKSNPSSNFVYQPLLSISQASPIGFCCCCYCDFCAESVEYFVSLLLWLLDDNIDMNRSIDFQSLQWSKEKWGISQTTLTRASKLQVTL